MLAGKRTAGACLGMMLRLSMRVISIRSATLNRFTEYQVKLCERCLSNLHVMLWCKPASVTYPWSGCAACTRLNKAGGAGLSHCSTAQGI